jgi:hypothetical protein
LKAIVEACLAKAYWARGLPNLTTHYSIHIHNFSTHCSAIMSTNPLVQTIEPDEPSVPAPQPSGNITVPSNTRAPVVLTPTNRGSGQMASNPSDAESGTFMQWLLPHNVKFGMEFQALQEYFGR